MPLTVGQTAPKFTLPDQSGKTHTLTQYLGQWVLLYFYPKDDTPGCTTEACQIRDNWTEFNRKKVVVLGVSADSVDSHQQFAQKHTLPFTLLADETRKVITQYGAYGEKTLFGKKIAGTKRQSFLIDPKGKIANIYLTVKPATHAQEVLADVSQLG